VPEAKRPDPKRRSPAPRPARAGDSPRGRPRGASSARREPRAIESQSAPEAEPDVAGDSIRDSIAASAEQQSDQRLGSAARRAAILAAVVCVLTLTIAGPVRTYFAQRTEVNQLAATEAKLRAQIAELEQQKVKLADPVYIAAQARERLGFVMPGEIPYQVQLPPTAAVPAAPGTEAAATTSNQPWYTSLWHTIADAPHGVSPTTPPDATATLPPVPTTTAPPGVPRPGG
jgi:cell division protein FtsB